MVKKRVKKERKISPRVLNKLNKIDKEINSLEKTQGNVLREEKRIEKKEEKIDRVLFQMGRLTFKRKHFLELIRGVAGAFLGVGLGMNLLNLKNLASTLPWVNILGIFLFILIISSLLIYKNERDFVKERGIAQIIKRLALLYLIVLGVELIALWLFGGIPESSGILVKMLIIGSYSAMAGAVSFSII